ncbi:helix-turn-helix domain-containing protein [Streptomyces sp. NPDC003016]
MTSHSRRGAAPVALPHLFRPAEVAEALGCSEWWVKEQARRRRIPFVRSGGGYRFTAEHFAEIICVLEERPLRNQGPATEEGAAPQRRRTKQPAPTAGLRAKRPRRAVRSDSSASAA